MIESLITEHLDLWTSAIEAKSTAGRGGNNKFDLYGIKKLRELILELAVRGKLVTQDPEDESASLLYARIEKDLKSKLDSGEIKKLKKFEPISCSEHHYDVPNLWIPIRIGQIFNVVYGKGISTTELKSEGFPVFGANGVIGLFDTYNYEDSQLLISCRGAYSGKPNISPEKCFITSNSLILESNWKYLCQKYFYYALSIANKSKIVTGSAQPQVTTTNLDPFVILLPPLRQQYKIALKVDELMTLCDQLEQQTLTSMEAHTTLVETLLATLTASSDADELAQNWNRISEHFDTLFTTEQSIDLLKQTILQLAVMGKLVPQDPEDEPASVLLEKIAAEKAQLIKDKKIKKEKPLPAISDDETPFELPQGWEWCRLGALNIEFQNGASSRGDTSGREITVVRLADIKNGFINLDEPRALLINENSIARYTLCNEDMLIIRVNGSADIVGRFILTDKDYDAIYCDHFIRMRQIGAKLFDSNYLKMISESRLLREKINDLFITTAGQKTVNQTHISSLVLAFPPLNEQKKITEKAEVLLNICQRLKNNVQKANQIQLYITDSIVDGSLSEV